MKIISFFLIRGLLIFSLVFILFTIIRGQYFKKFKKKSNFLREVIMSVFAGYIALLALFMFTPIAYINFSGIDINPNHFDFVRNFSKKSIKLYINIIPFKTILAYLRYSNLKLILLNIIGNIILFIPFGLLMSILYVKFQKIYKVLLYSFFLSLIIEFIQLFIGRSVDIDDIILNVLGGLIGYILYVIIVYFKVDLKKVSL